MLKLTKTGIGLLTKQYRSVLRKCLLCNLGVFIFATQSYATFKIWYNTNSSSLDPTLYNALYSSYHSNNSNWDTNGHVNVYTTSDFSISDYYTKAQTDALLNYYYTFQEKERAEVIEFAKELRSNKKEMSSLDFMPIKSSSDLRINWIKAEDPLTFSAKTRDDSLDLMEVCHA